MADKRKLRLLVVEDEPEIALIVQTMLRELYEFEVIDGDFENVLTRRFDDIDAALVDLMLPGRVSGVVVLQFIRLVNPNVWRVAFSGAWDLLEMAAPFANATLQKPFSPEQLHAALRLP